MKAPILLLLLWLGVSILDAQTYYSIHLNPSDFKAGELLALQSDQGDLIKFTTVATRLKGLKKKMKPLEINGQKVILIEKVGVIQIRSDQAKLLMTNSDRSEVFVDNQRFQRELKQGYGKTTINYLDGNGNKVVEGLVNSEQIFITLFPNISPSLALLCAEEMLREFKSMYQVTSWSYFSSIAAIL